MFSYSKISTKGTYSLIVIYVKVAGISILTVDEANSCNLIIKDMFEHIDIDVDNEETTEALAKIAWYLTKKSLTTSNTIIITIINNE